MIAIIDFGMGNLGSIHNMFLRIGIRSIITSDPKIIESAEKLILPGVGAFDTAMMNLNKLGLIPLLNEKVITKSTPLLGICLGMQLLTKRSDEGRLPGLGWIDAQTTRFSFENENAKLKIPHMGWNNIHIVRPNPLLDGLSDQSRFYFVHSFYVQCNSTRDILTTSQYGMSFASIVNMDNIYGTQFHPEKSHKYGMTLLKTFAEMK